MKYKYLNEVLLNWNSDEDFQDNNIIKSSDIKRQIDKCFIYRIEDEPSKIHIFDGEMHDFPGWREYKKYKNKVYIDGKQIKLDKEGYTVNEFNLGEYRVYIEDIDKIKDMGYMFWNCEQLVSAFIPDSFTAVSKFMFQDCYSLTSVIIPSSVTYIDGYAFDDCTSLTSLTIPNSVTAIGYHAFNCSGLTNITIPNSVIEIEESAFWGCNNLQTVYVEDINKFNQIKFRNESSNPLYYGAKLIEI